MTNPAPLTPDAIRAFQAENPKMRSRDQANHLGISEAELVAAHVGRGVTAIAAHPDQVIGAAQRLGEVMALTRNESCVNEKVGRYDNYHSGQHATMVLTEEIDLRMFPSHWRHAFMVETETASGPKRSLQVFDAAGDAVHKIFLRAGSSLTAWEALRLSLALPEQSPTLSVDPRKPPEAAKSNAEKIDVLREEWRRMTDTHQFLCLTSKLRMNRLGAYRIAGAPFVRALATEAVNTLLIQLAQTGTEVMIFVGNRGCIQIHSGPIVTLKPMGPWQNVMDPRFNLHLRLDHVAEVWAVDKPTQRGAAISVEAFDAQGSLIFQIFGLGKEGRDNRDAFGQIVETLPGLQEADAEALT